MKKNFTVFSYFSDEHARQSSFLKPLMFKSGSFENLTKPALILSCLTDLILIRRMMHQRPLN